MNIFEQATKMGLRFTSTSGGLTVEDVWNLPLTGRSLSLDSLAKGLNKQLKESEEESFVVKASTASTKTTLKFDIIKHIIAVRLAEKEASVNSVANKSHNEKILSLIAKKEEDKLGDLSIEELTASLKA